MVYTTQRFKIIPNPAAQPISIGEDPVPGSTIGGNPFDALLRWLQGTGNIPPIQIGTPGTGTSTGTIDEPPSPTTCPAGYALNNQNQCVLIPLGTGLGDITQVEVPTTSVAGGSIIIKTWFKNKGTSTLDYKVRIVITGLNI